MHTAAQRGASVCARRGQSVLLGDRLRVVEAAVDGGHASESAARVGQRDGWKGTGAAFVDTRGGEAFSESGEASGAVECSSPSRLRCSRKDAWYSAKRNWERTRRWCGSAGVRLGRRECRAVHGCVIVATSLTGIVSCATVFGSIHGASQRRAKVSSHPAPFSSGCCVTVRTAVPATASRTTRHTARRGSATRKRTTARSRSSGTGRAGRHGATASAA